MLIFHFLQAFLKESGVLFEKSAASVFYVHHGGHTDVSRHQEADKHRTGEFCMEFSGAGKKIFIMPVIHISGVNYSVS